jgi:hypothetical protein
MTKERASLEEQIEAAYWVFDAQRKGYKPHPLAKSERDAFKDTLRAFIAERAASEPKAIELGHQPCFFCAYPLAAHRNNALGHPWRVGPSVTDADLAVNALNRGEGDG